MATVGQKYVIFYVDAKPIRLEVPAEIRAYLNEQFCKHTDAQRHRKATLMNLLALAYKKGHEHGAAER